MESTPELEKGLDAANKLINEDVELLQKCGALMIAETRSAPDP